MGALHYATIWTAAVMLRSCNHEEHLAGPPNMCSTEGEEIYSIGMAMRPSCSATSGEILTCVPCMLHFVACGIGPRPTYPFFTNKDVTDTVCFSIKIPEMYPVGLFWTSTVQN